MLLSALPSGVPASAAVLGGDGKPRGGPGLPIDSMSLLWPPTASFLLSPGGVLAVGLSSAEASSSAAACNTSTSCRTALSSLAARRCSSADPGSGQLSSPPRQFLHSSCMRLMLVCQPRSSQACAWPRSGLPSLLRLPPSFCSRLTWLLQKQKYTLPPLLTSTCSASTTTLQVKC